MKCPNCGKDNADGAKFCQGCGAPLTSSATRPNVKETTPPPPPPGPTSYYAQYGSMLQPPQKPKNRGMLIALIVCGIVVVGLAIFLGFMLAGTEREKDYDTTALSLYSDDVAAGSDSAITLAPTEAAPADAVAVEETKVDTERQLKLTSFGGGNHLESQAGNTYYDKNMLDGNPATAWALHLNLDPTYRYYPGPQFNIEPFRKITAVVIQNGYGKSREAFKNNTRAAWVQIARFNEYSDGEYAESYAEEGVSKEDIIYEGPLKDTMEPQRLPVSPNFNPSKPTKRILVGFKNDRSGFYRGAKWDDLCISELKIYGE